MHHNVQDHHWKYYRTEDYDVEYNMNKLLELLLHG